MDHNFIIKSIRNEVITDTELYTKIESRFFPHAINLGGDDITYPFISFVFSGGSPDRDKYPHKVAMLEFYFVSDSSMDQAYGLYNRFIEVINNKRFMSEDKTFNFCIYEDSLCIDSTTLINGKLVYIASNTMVARTMSK